MDPYEYEIEERHQNTQSGKDRLKNKFYSPCIECEHRSDEWCQYYKKKLCERDGLLKPCHPCNVDTWFILKKYK